MRSAAVDALLTLPADAVVGSSPYCATPTTLLSALAEAVPGMKNPTLTAGLLLGESTVYDAIGRGALHLRTWHVSQEARSLSAQGRISYVPLRALDVAKRAFGQLDAAMVRVTPPDRNGQVSLGPSASYSRDMLLAARMRFAEVDETLPRTRGVDVSFSLDDFDVVIDSQTSAGKVRPPEPSERLRRVARNVVALIPDGAAIQLGIGTMSDAIAMELAESSLSGLRIIGMVTDHMLPLMNSSRIQSGSDSVVAVELLGSQELFAWAHENESLLMASSATVHNPLWLSRQPNLVSVCSALEVDSTGQVVSEQLGLHAIAGVGGAMDFFEGAHLSVNGMRIVALPSSTSAGIRRVGNELDGGSAVTIPRHSVDAVVTEHGAAILTGLSLAERRDALALVQEAEPSTVPL